MKQFLPGPFHGCAVSDTLQHLNVWPLQTKDFIRNGPQDKPVSLIFRGTLGFRGEVDNTTIDILQNLWFRLVEKRDSTQIPSATPHPNACARAHTITAQGQWHCLYKLKTKHLTQFSESSTATQNISVISFPFNH